MKSRTIAILGLAAAGAVIGGSVAIHAAQNKTVLRVETRLIQINVVAWGSHGRPATGLTKNDFRLYDNGKPVPIDVFSAISRAPEPHPFRPLPANVFSNLLPLNSPSVTVILMDGMNTAFVDRVYGTREVKRFLKRVGPKDRVAVFALLGSRLRVLQSFTNDPKLLLAALQKKKKKKRNRNPGEAEASAQPGATGGSVQAPADSVTAEYTTADEVRMKKIVRRFEMGSTYWEGINPVEAITGSLVDIAKYMGQFPGRKNLIWLSDGFPIFIDFEAAVGPRPGTPQRYVYSGHNRFLRLLLGAPPRPANTEDLILSNQPIERAYEALNYANVAVYPVMAAGLVVNTGWGFYGSVATMQELASYTGGKAFYNTNGLARAMKSAVDDYHAGYTIGFYPNIAWDGKYHTLKLKVLRHGVHLRYRRGYFATGPAVKQEVGKDLAFNRAIYAPLNLNGVGLEVSVLKTVQTPKRQVELGIDVDAHNITLKAGRASKSMDLAVVLAQSSAEGSVLHADGYDMKLNVAAGSVPSLMKDGIRMTKWVDLEKKADALGVVVRDTASGNIGSVRVSLVTPPRPRKHRRWW